MKRVVRQTSFKSLILLLLFFLCSAQSSFATTVTIPSDDDMVVGARAILRGKVVAIESSFDEHNGRIYTYITVKVQEVFKGQIAERKIVLKELGGQVGDRASVVFGNPQFKKGEKVLLYLDTWADGSLRTYQMFLGKFNIENDPLTGEEIAFRSSPDENTTILQHQLHGHGAPGPSTERLVLRRYIRMVRNRLAANWQRSLQFDAEVYANKPLFAEPTEYRSIAGKGDITPNFTFLGPYRFFEPDTGQPVSFTLNPNPSSDQGVPQVVLSSADVVAAGSAWSNVSGCALQMSYSGSLNECYVAAGTPGVHVVSNNCDGRNGATAGCANILAWGGVSQTGFQTRTINGTTFRQSIQGFVSMNPWAACSFTNNCNVREILTHEIGHAIGLGHSQFSDATMAAFAHFDGRCASIRTDDVSGIRAIYPGSGGGPGPLTITTSTLANGTTGSSYSQTLQASGGTSPYSWSIVSGLGNLPPGLGLNASSGVISGTPTTAGTYNFTVRVTDSVPATTQKALSIIVSQPGIAYNSQFVSQTTPTSVTPGQTFNVNMKWLNTGTQTWNAPVFYMVSQNPALNYTWLGGQFNAVDLGQFTVPPGQQLNFTFGAIAPTTPGTYNFQWQLYKDNGTQFFGQMSTNVVIQVGSTPPPSSDADGDGMPYAVEVIEARNPLVKDNDIFNNARWFAMQQYRDYLGREGEPSGITYWTNQITSGQQTRAQVIDNFFDSPEFQTVTPIARLYFAYFLRIPDYGGLLYWVNQSRSGVSLDAISQAFAQSPEFITRYGSLNNEAFVTLVYQNVLGRAPDPAGFAYWTGLLNSGAYTRGQVMLGFSESPEYKASSFNKVYVTQMYVGMLRRSPEQEGFDYWVHQMELGQSGLNLINGFLVAPEYHGRFMP
jgi:hypothetical protein